MTYVIASGKSLNMVLSHVDHSDPATWKPRKAVKDMQAYFEGWDPRLTKIIAMIEKTRRWSFLSGIALERWVASSKKTLISGDAAHAMLPYMSQGAAMAVEYAAALARVLYLIDTTHKLATALEVFEAERMKGTRQLRNTSLLNGKIRHYPDGPEQRAPHESIKPEVEWKSFTWSANQ